MPAFFHFQHTLNRLFNNCRGGGGGWRGFKLTPPLPRKKTLLKKPSLIRVKYDNVCRRYKTIFSTQRHNGSNEWFVSNNLPLNVKKTKFSIFHKVNRRDNLPIVLPKLFINNEVTKRQSSIKFLGILLDENLPWKEHLKLTENKIAKESFK